MQTYLNNNRFIDSYWRSDSLATILPHFSLFEKNFYFYRNHLSLFSNSLLFSIFNILKNPFLPNRFISSYFGPEFERLNSDIWMRMHTHMLANYHTPKSRQGPVGYTFLHRVPAKFSRRNNGQWIQRRVLSDSRSL